MKNTAMLRHTYAAMLYDAGVDVKSAQKFLGHAGIEMTLSVYIHLTKFKVDGVFSLSAWCFSCDYMV